MCYISDGVFFFIYIYIFWYIYYVYASFDVYVCFSVFFSRGRLERYAGVSRSNLGRLEPFFFLFFLLVLSEIVSS